MSEAQYFQRRTNMSRQNCSFLLEHYRRFTDPKTGTVLVACASVYEDGMAYLSPPLPFSVPVGAIDSTAAAYAGARYQALRGMAKRRAQQREEKKQRQQVEEMRRGLAALATTPPAPERSEASRPQPVVVVSELVKFDKLLDKVAAQPAAVEAPLPLAAGPSLLDDITVLDLEFQQDSLLEIAAIRFVNGEPVGEYVSLVHFTGQVWAAVFQLTGISTLHVSDPKLPREREALQQFKKLAGDSLLVCHSIGADKRVLEAARTRQGATSELSNPWLCTLALAKRHVKAGLLPSGQKCGLGELCQHFKIKTRGAHRAKADVLMCHQLLRALHQQQPITKADLHGAPQPGKSRKAATPTGPGLFNEAA